MTRWISATPEGRVTLRDSILIITRHGQCHEQALTGQTDYEAALRDYFGIDLGL